MEENLNMQESAAQTFVKQIEGMTYVVRVHFDDQAKETMEQKVKKLLRRDVLSVESS